MTQFMFVRVPGDHADTVLVSGMAACGRMFDLGLILEPDAENPVISLDIPFGIVGLATLAAQYFEWREAA